MAPTNMACEILVHLPGIQPLPQHEKGRVLTTGLLGSPQQVHCCREESLTQHHVYVEKRREKKRVTRI